VKELLKVRLVAPGSDSPQEMGMGIESLEFHTPPMTPEQQQKLDQLRAQAMRKIRRRIKADE
jgi:hypothetical protein